MRFRPSRFTILPLFLLLFSCSALAQNSKENADFKLAMNLFNDGLFELAAEQLRQFIGTYPNTTQGTEARFYLGLSLMKLGQMEEARVTFQTFALSYQDNPKAPEAWKYVGDIYATQQNHREAALAYERVKVFHPRSPLAPESLVLAGRQFGQAGLPDDARRVLRIVLQEYPASGAVHSARTALAELYFKQGQTALARSELLRVVEGDPSADARAQALLILGDIDRAQWRLDDAITRYREILAKHTGSSASAPARVHLGNVLNVTGKHSEAVGLFEKALTDKSMTDSLLRREAGIGLGVAYHGNGEFEKAIREYEKAAGAGGDPEVLFLIGSSAHKAGNAGRVAETGDRILSLNPPDELRRRTFGLLAASALDSRNYNEAVRVYSRFLEQYPGDPASPSVLLRAANVARGQLRDPRRGALYGEAIIARYPRSPEAVKAHLLAAGCYEKLGDIDRAVELWQMLAENYPSAESVSVARARIKELVTFEAKDKDSAVDQLALLLGDVATGEQKQDIAFRLGKTYFENLKNYEAAADQFSRVINSGSTGGHFEEALLLRSKAYEYLSWRNPSYRQRAIESYKTFLDSYSSHPAADEAIQSLFNLQAGSLAEAERAYADLLSAHPAMSGKPEMLLKIGMLQQEADRSDDAKKTFDSILRGFGTSPAAEEASYRRFQLSLAGGELDSAYLQGERYSAKYPEGAHTAEVLYRTGEMALESGDASGAIRRFSRLVNGFEYTTFAVNGRQSLASAHASSGNYNDAITICDEMMRRAKADPFGDQPGETDLVLGAASAYRMAGRTTEARELLYGLLEQDPRRGEAFAALGMLARAEGDADLAAAYFRQAAITDPGAGSTREVADLMFDSGAYADAIERYQALITPSTREEDARYFRTRIILARLRSDQLPAAQKEIGEFAKKHPKHENELGAFELEKGNHFFRKAEYKTARASYDIVLKRYDDTPSAPDALFWMGKTFEAEGNAAEARKRFELLLKEYPQSSVVLRGHFAMGNLSYNAEQWDEAIRHYRIVVENPATGDDLLPFAMSNLIETYEAAGVFDAALDLARRYLDRYPAADDSFDKKIKIGILYQRLGYNDQAVAHLQGLLDQAGSDLEGEIRYYIAEANFNKGDFQQAILDFLKVPYLVTKKGKIDWTANSLYMAGQSYERIGKYDQAIAMYKQILERGGIDETFKAAAKKEIDRVNLVLKGPGSERD